MLARANGWGGFALAESTRVLALTFLLAIVALAVRPYLAQLGTVGATLRVVNTCQTEGRNPAERIDRPSALASGAGDAIYLVDLGRKVFERWDPATCAV